MKHRHQYDHVTTIGVMLVPAPLADHRMAAALVGSAHGGEFHIPALLYK